ncbi:MULTISPECIES: hypothetical protein [unclassified Mesorhizobium]|uniref:hypothetical protein n=1 Tax=unclassified Mesorhizobium TaxID=325217 RepID=UPI0011866B03|nr:MULTISPECIES: hypothetical protein [unclassified Mesorhizobium]
MLNMPRRSRQRPPGKAIWLHGGVRWGSRNGARKNGALKGTWLESGICASVVGTVLDQLANLARSLQERDAMRHRVEKMETDRVNFVVEVAAATTAACEPDDEEEPEQLAARLAARLELAERNRETKANLVGKLKRPQEARETLNVEISGA